MTELKPCTKFIDNNLYKQFKHIKEEYQEVRDEFYYICIFPANAINYDKGLEHLAEELVDLQTSCETMLAILKIDVDMMRQRVIAKNEARNYYATAADKPQDCSESSKG